MCKDKNKTVWEATLHIANSADGRKILYDIDPIKKVEGARKSAPTTTTNVPQNDPDVKTQFYLSNSNTDVRGTAKGILDTPGNYASRAAGFTGIWDSSTAPNTSRHPRISQPVMVSCSSRHPPRTAKTLSMLISREAVVGSSSR